MKVLTINTILLALYLTATGAQASTLSLSADSNPLPNAEQYQFNSNPFTSANFSDILNLSITPNRDLVASLSGTSNELINFTRFDLYSGFSDGANTLVEIGDVISPLPQLSFGSLIGTSLASNYFIKIEGSQSGFSSYNGNISLTDPSVSAVPLPAAMPLMLSGLGMLGFAKRRINKQIT